MNIQMGVASAGLKESGDPDLLVISLPCPCTASFLYTDNFFKAGSVLYSEAISKSRDKISAFVVNSGNANCGTGEEGIKHAEMMAERIAQNLGVPSEEVLVFSTGVIGKPLPIDSVLSAIDHACNNLENLDLKKASETISTTDAFPKYHETENGDLKTFGFGKGAGMIAPSMATMLAFVFTNAKVDYWDLVDLHQKVTEKTFNSITVDGCKSTNDSFGLISLGEVEASLEDVERQVHDVSLKIAKDIVRDGEGATRVIKIDVKNAILEMKAKEIAKAVANSLLVKTAIYGRDPNWGRILSAVGSTEFPVDPYAVRIEMGGIPLYDQRPLEENEEKVKSYLEESEEVEISVDLREGNNEWTYYSSDIGYEYIKINAEYRT